LPLDPGDAANIDHSVLWKHGFDFTAQEMLVFSKLDRLDSSGTIFHSLSKGNLRTVSCVENHVVNVSFIVEEDQFDLL